MSFCSPKIFDGYSTCFRQWRAEGTHCKFLHGYAVYFKVIFKGELDERNWCVDFGISKRSQTLIEGKTLKEYLDWLLDHTTIIAKDDPELQWFQDADNKGLIQLRIIDHTGAERFAEFLYDKINKWVRLETKGRVYIESIEFFENGKNSAIYKESNYKS